MRAILLSAVMIFSVLRPCAAQDNPHGGPRPPAPLPPTMPAPPSPGEPAAPTAESQPAPATPALAHAEGAISSEMRDPFWPVGYRPRAPGVAAKPGPTLLPEATPPSVPRSEPNWAKALARIQVRGIIAGRGGKSFATVNDRLVEPGDEVSVTWDGFQYRWRIQSIEPKGIVTEQLDVRRAP